MLAGALTVSPVAASPGQDPSTAVAGGKAASINYPNLQKVSCPTASFCMAVGDQTIGSAFASTKRVLVERWDGSRWSLSPTPAVAGKSLSLSGVSCVSTTSCVAVGTVYSKATGTKPLAERWNGTSWSISSALSPTSATYAELVAIRCVSTTRCFAVGSFTRSNVTRMLIEYWNGSTWKIGTSPNLSGKGPSYLYAVACANQRFCYAVGSYRSANGLQRTLTLKWNSAQWSVVASPNPTGSSEDPQLVGVSCPTSSCMAVGLYSVPGSLPTDDIYKTLTERWNGSQWTIVASPNGSRFGDGFLSGVFCTSPLACIAVGGAGGQTLAERWDGRTWTVLPSPNPASDFVGLSSVSCAGSTCFAVGGYGEASVHKTLIERFDGSRWAIQPSPNP